MKRRASWWETTLWHRSISLWGAWSESGDLLAQTPGSAPSLCWGVCHCLLPQFVRAGCCLPNSPAMDTNCWSPHGTCRSYSSTHLPIAELKGCWFENLELLYLDFFLLPWGLSLWGRRRWALLRISWSLSRHPTATPHTSLFCKS